MIQNLAMEFIVNQKLLKENLQYNYNLIVQINLYPLMEWWLKLSKKIYGKVD